MTTVHLLNSWRIIQGYSNLCTTYISIWPFNAWNQPAVVQFCKNQRNLYCTCPNCIQRGMSQFAINLLWFVRLSFMAEMLTQLLKVVVLKSFVWLNGTGYFRMWQNNWLSIARTASCQSTLNISLLLVWQLFATGICNSPVWITEHTKEVNMMFCTPKHHTCKLKIFKICYLQQKDLSKWFFLVLTQQKYL